MSEMKKIFYKHNVLNFTFALLGAIGKALLTILIAFLLKEFMDISAQGTMDDVKQIMIKFLLFLILMIGIESMYNIFVNRFIYKGMKQYKEYVFCKLLHKHIGAFLKEPTSSYISALSNDSTTIETNYLESIFQLIMHICMFVGALCSMAYLNITLTICVLLTCIIPIIVSVVFGKKLESVEKNTSLRNANFLGLMKDLLTGFSVIKSFKAEQEVLERYIDDNQKAELAKKQKRDILSIVTIASGLSSFLVNLVVFGLGAYLIVQGEISVGTVIAFVQLLNYVISPIEVLPKQLSARKASGSLIEKIAKACAKEHIQQNYENISEFQNKIEFKNVDFAYKENRKILNDVSICFEKGKNYAIVGASGSSKSTLLNILLGYHGNFNGNITIDGVSIKNIQKESLYDMISIIQQNVFVFDNSIKDNITMFKGFTNGEYHQAIEKAGLVEFIEEKGEDYLCGENGCLLSGGEKQRISIARSLLKKTPILLMDEATAALDHITAQKIEEAVLCIEQLTSIVITHKMEASLLKQYDKLLVMKEGTIYEQGSFEELYEKKGYFYSLYTVGA